MVRAVQRSGPGFEVSYRRHLAVEQRRAVLDALARSFAPDATVGEIVDAAAALGWADLGELSLSDLADALLSPEAAAAQRSAVAAAESDDDDNVVSDDDDADSDADDDGDGDGDGEEAPEPASARGAKATAKATVPAPEAAVATAQPAKPAKRKVGKPTKISLDERMSLDEAAAVLLPLVRQIGEATMQQLEQSTAGAGRRKLRFHIGQLVKNGRLARHGMGRGTYYTLS